ncbi:MAG: CaiB/BaiF CoA-transferase family protein [Woeseiaceae bacterium]|nr:CaiB/BaiF CoA-transferase family protein [Woeseiaceae bacterium]
MLEGVRIVEIEGLGPGPFAGMLLADLGAEVVVVHREQPPSPGWPERNLIDRGKKSIVLDLKDDADRSTLKRLLSTADGLIEGFRPGVMERLGFSPDAVHEVNPALVYGRMTGWGQDGPMAQQAGHDLNYIGVSGALWYASEPGTAPFTPPTLAGDIGGGALYLVTGMLAGLLKAKSTGEGCVVDAAIVDGSAHTMNLLMSTRAAGLLADVRGQSYLDGPPWSRCYETADGRWLSVQCLEAKFYALFLERLGLSDDPTFRQDPDPSSWAELGDCFATVFAGKPLQHWVSLFEGTDACVAPVLSPAESRQHPHMLARSTWLEKDGQLQARAAPRFDGRVPDEPLEAPTRGQHTAAILAELERSG